VTWRAYLGKTMTGQVGPQLDAVGGSLDDVLNDVKKATVVATEASLDGVSREWWSVWAGCVLVSFEDWYQPETLIAACPITSPVKQDRKTGTVTFDCAGVEALLDRRVVLDRDYRPGDEEKLRHSTIAWDGVSLGSIVGRVVEKAIRKRNGFLPIVISAEEKARRQRTYEGWNLANNGAWKRIKEITEVIGGPDVAFRAEWANEERTQFQWRLVTGTEAQPSIAQKVTPVWDATAARSPVAAISVTSSAEALANRVYCTGAGEGAGTLVKMAEAGTIPEWFPLLENVITDSDSENQDLLKQKAEAGVATQALDQISLSIFSDETAPIGSWHVGDQVEVVTRGWLEVPDGSHLLRVIAAKYNLDSNKVDVELQQDRLGAELAW